MDSPTGRERSSNFPATLLFPPEFFGRRFDDLRNAHGTRRRGAHAKRQPILKRILEANLNRVHPEFFGELIDLTFCHEQGLGRPESAEGRSGEVVSIYAVYISFYVRDEVGAGGRNR